VRRLALEQSNCVSAEGDAALLLLALLVSVLPGPRRVADGSEQYPCFRGSACHSDWRQRAVPS
jgi:hypothetical protein